MKKFLLRILCTGGIFDMLYYLLERIRARRRKAAALREIRRNGWRCPWLGDGRRRLRWRA